jgi:hypothetical protein
MGNEIERWSEGARQHRFSEASKAPDLCSIYRLSRPVLFLPFCFCYLVHSQLEEVFDSSPSVTLSCLSIPTVVARLKHTVTLSDLLLEYLIIPSQPQLPKLNFFPREATKAILKPKHAIHTHDLPCGPRGPGVRLYPRRHHSTTEWQSHRPPWTRRAHSRRPNLYHHLDS